MREREGYTACENTRTRKTLNTDTFHAVIVRGKNLQKFRTNFQTLISICFINSIHRMHCVKSVQIRSYFWSVFSCIRTEYGDLQFSPNTGKYGPEITPYLDTFHAVLLWNEPWENFWKKMKYFSSVQVHE